MPKKSEKHTPVVISDCCASADNWLRFKVMCDLTLIHNSTRELHTRVNKGKSKAKKLLTVRSTLEIGSGPPNETRVPAFLQADTGTHLQGQAFEPKGSGAAFQPHLLLSPVHPDMLTLSARDFFFPPPILCLRCENSWLPKLFWAAVLGLRL